MKKRTIDGVREYYNLPDDFTDEQISKKYKGSFGEFSANVNIFVEAVKNNMPKILSKFFTGE